MALRCTSLWMLLLLTCLCSGLPVARGEGQHAGALMTASDGAGGIRLIWVAPDGLAPLAWRLEEESAGRTRVIEDRIPVPADTAGNRDAAQGELLRAGRVLATARLLGDWTLAQAQGVARELHDVPGGERRYRVVPLGADGAALGAAMRGRVVDSRKADPLPPPVQGLKIQAVRGGAELYWQPGQAPRVPPGVAWLVERDGTAVPGSPVLLGERWPAARRAYLDTGVVLETEVHYRVAAVDVFGRAGPWSEASAFIADIAARDPPRNLAAVVAGNDIRLRWAASANTFTSGYVLERSVLRGGPYEALTPRGLERTTTEFVDESATAGTWYFYRLRAMDPRGVLGEPSLPAAARVLPPDLPRPPALRAEVGTSQVTLRWEPLPGVAGYYLQRRPAGAAQWQLLNDPITAEPRYDDTGLPAGGRFEYRLVVVGYDSRESEPGAALSVVLPDTQPPAAPRIVAIEGSGGRARLRFMPAEPLAESARFLVLRGGAADDPGVVIGDPLPGTAREWTDDWVLAGESYWYRLVALDAAGNRSALSPAVSVRIGAGAVPAPAPPQARMVNEPIAGIELRFAPPPAGLAVLLQRREGDAGQWHTVAGPSSAQWLVDSEAPSGQLAYRLVYRARDGSEGSPSAVVNVSRP
ncbi:MAG: hypothetical protein AMXMBFR45_23910 [Gammaproteobacteria bacterium]|nr:fibronectin type III domain-containing protein [Gammaproteobacteria bacterium PRO2]